MTTVMLGMLAALALSLLVVALVAVPARRQGRDLLTPQGEQIVQAALERTAEVASAALDKTAEVAAVALDKTAEVAGSARERVRAAGADGGPDGAAGADGGADGLRQREARASD